MFDKMMDGYAMKEMTPAVTRSDGRPATLADLINPTPAISHPDTVEGRINPDAFDGFYNANDVMESGQVQWREMKVDGLSSCGRSNKRARILAIENGSTTITSTSTSTSTSTAAGVTFTVGLACTSAGVTFAVPAC